MVGEPDGNDEVLEFGDTGRGMSRRRKLVCAVGGAVVAGAAITASVVGIGGPAHGAAQVPVPRTAPVVKLNGIILQEQTNGVILTPVAARRPVTGHVPCDRSP
jgi:hypothetical protein